MIPASGSMSVRVVIDAETGSVGDIVTPIVMKATRRIPRRRHPFIAE